MRRGNWDYIAQTSREKRKTRHTLLMRDIIMHIKLMITTTFGRQKGGGWHQEEG